MGKEEVREQLRQRRNALASEEVVRMSSEILRHILNSKMYNDASSIGCYWPVGNEVNTIPLIEDALKRGKRVCVPKMRGASFDHMIINSIDDLEQGKNRVPEPKGEEVVPYGGLDMVIVPGLVFDKHGYRVGYGHGGYDRYLSDRDGRAVGVAFEFQLVLSLPVVEHDIPVDYVVTEKGWVNVMVSREGETE